MQVKRQDGRPLIRINELEMVKGFVFANVWFDDHLYKIDPVTGIVVDAYSFSELYPKVREGIQVTHGVLRQVYGCFSWRKKSTGAGRVSNVRLESTSITS